MCCIDQETLSIIITYAFISFACTPTKVFSSFYTTEMLELDRPRRGKEEAPLLHHQMRHFILPQTVLSISFVRLCLTDFDSVTAPQIQTLSAMNPNVNLPSVSASIIATESNCFDGNCASFSISEPYKMQNPISHF